LAEVLKEVHTLDARVGVLEAEVAKLRKPTLKVGTTRVFIRGADEKSNPDPKDPAAKDTVTSTAGSFETAIPRKGLVAAWPVIQDHKQTYNAYARWWQKPPGFFGVSVQPHNGEMSIILGGTGFKQGRYVIDVVYLYEE
jgi:hypothetical protein